MSSATVRNEMHALETEGYLAQPHTSAGRIPTEKGYRFFVDAMTGTETLSPANVAKVSEFFAVAHGELEQMLRETSHLLSGLTGTAAVVTGEQGRAATIRSVQLVDLSPHLLMVVVVTSNGVVLKRTVDLATSPGGPDVVDADRLADAQRMLAEHLTGNALTDVATWSAPEAAPAPTSQPWPPPRSPRRRRPRAARCTSTAPVASPAPSMPARRSSRCSRCSRSSSWW